MVADVHKNGYKCKTCNEDVIKFYETVRETSPSSYLLYGKCKNDHKHNYPKTPQRSDKERLADELKHNEIYMREPENFKFL